MLGKPCIYSNALKLLFWFKVKLFQTQNLVKLQTYVINLKLLQI